MKIAIICSSGLPVPAVKGGAIETLVEIICKENEVYKNTGDANAKSDTELLDPVKEKLQQEGYTINDDNTITIGKTTINISYEIASASTGENGSSGGNVTIEKGDNNRLSAAAATPVDYLL